MFRTHQSQILSKRFESIVEKMSELMERALQTQTPAYAMPVRVQPAGPDMAARRRRSRRRSPIATGISHRSTWY